jgi:hypothetical protein
MTMGAEDKIWLNGTLAGGAGKFLLYIAAEVFLF